MNKLMIAACAALLSISINTNAQTSAVPAVQTQKGTVQDEIRSTSGQLKETYGLVSQNLGMLNREIGTDATAATPEQSAMRDKLKTSLSQLEGMLTTVNTANEAQWSEIKAKAELVRSAALKLVAERKAAK